MRPSLPADRRIAYALLRFGFGVNLAMHGVDRLLGGIGGFASKMADDFAATPLPRVTVLWFSRALPLAELALGLLILAGAWTRVALVCGSLLMTCLMFGTALRGAWNVLAIQLLYLLVYYVLLSRRGDDVFGVDAWR